MARKAVLPIEKRTLKGARVAAVLMARGITVTDFLAEYEAVELARASKWDDAEALKARLAELQAKVA